MAAKQGLDQGIATGIIAITGENLSELKDGVTKDMGICPSTLSFSAAIQRWASS